VCPLVTIQFGFEINNFVQHPGGIFAIIVWGEYLGGAIGVSTLKWPQSPLTIVVICPCNPDCGPPVNFPVPPTGRNPKPSIISALQIILACENVIKIIQFWQYPAVVRD
jgi:hypothetical protein